MNTIDLTKNIQPKFQVMDLVALIPNSLIEALGIKDYNPTATDLETPGDILDIRQLLEDTNNWVIATFTKGQRRENPLTAFLAFYKFTQSCYGVMAWKEWEQLPITKEYLNNYPNLTRTSQIHAWG